MSLNLRGEKLVEGVQVDLFSGDIQAFGLKAKPLIEIGTNRTVYPGLKIVFKQSMAVLSEIPSLCEIE
jgi:hypothetical protein